MTGLASEDFDDKLFPANELYEAGWATVGTDSGLAIPAVPKNAPEVANFGSDGEGVFE
jgi:hypothetical protein